MDTYQFMELKKDLEAIRYYLHLICSNKGLLNENDTESDDNDEPGEDFEQVNKA